MIGSFEVLDVLDRSSMQALISKFKVTEIYHLAAVLSAKAENMPLESWSINMQGLLNVLEAARIQGDVKVYWPSSIGVFGPSSPKKNTPQHCIKDPSSVYGISKLAGERWCEYYYTRYQVDVRSLRYPGIIGYTSPPGGGTTDYAVNIFYKALQDGQFECFLKEATYLPMMYIEDAIRATIELMAVPATDISIRTSYNLSAMSFCPRELAEAIRTRIPDFKITYNPDFRQEIADSWPASIDDQVARHDWNWEHHFDIHQLVKTMLDNLAVQLT